MADADMADTKAAVIDAMAKAIATFEGYYIPKSIAQRKNNPGNLRPADGRGYCNFPTAASGWAALYDDIRAKFRKYPTFTLLQFFERYAPSTDGNRPREYAEFVVARINKDCGLRLTIAHRLEEII